MNGATIQRLGTLQGEYALRASIFAAFFVVSLSSATVVEAITIVPTDLNPGDEYRLVFLTSTTRDATSSNIADYNSFVTSAATAVPALNDLGTSWTAIGSTSTVDARDNTGTNPGVATGAPIYRLDDTRVADNNADLWDFTIAASVFITELGDTLLFPDVINFIWTGTGPDGVVSLAGGLGDSFPAVGYPGLTDVGWISGHVPLGAELTDANNLYVISGSLVVPIPEPSTFVLAGIAAAAGLLALPWRRRRTRCFKL